MPLVGVPEMLRWYATTLWLLLSFLILLCEIKANKPYIIAEAAAIPSVVGPMARLKENRGEEAKEYMTAKKAKTETAKLGMNMASRRNRIEGQANQRSAVRL